MTSAVGAAAHNSRGRRRWAGAVVVCVVLIGSSANRATATESTPSATGVDLSLSWYRSPPGNWIVGNSGSYNVTVRNNGPNNATSVVFTDTVPAGMRVTGRASSDFVCDLSGQTVTCRLGIMAGRTWSDINISVDVGPDTGSRVTNSATVKSSVADDNPANNTYSESHTVDRLADVHIEKLVGSVIVGGTARYRFDYTNDGPSPAEPPITITDNLPAGLSYVSSSPTSGGFTCSAGDIARRAVVCTNPNRLDAHTVAGIFIYVAVSEAAYPTVRNRADISSPTFDPNLSNNYSWSVTNVADPTAADLTAQLSHTDPLTVGSRSVFHLDATNNGPADSASLHVDLSFPPGLTPVSIGGADGFSCSLSASSATCDRGLTTAGQAARVDLNIDVGEAAYPLATVTAIVSGPAPDHDTSNNTAADTASVSRTPVLTSISVTPTNPAVPKGATRQFTATGTYSDASTTDLTSSATWVSSSPAVATLTPGGLARALAAGMSTVSATQGSVVGSTTLTVRSSTGVSVFRPSSGTWFVQGGPMTAWGTPGDIPVLGDYDGDGRPDVAVFRPSTGVWYIHPSGGGPDITVAWGAMDDIPVPGDYNGDGRSDVAVFRPSSGVWYIHPSGGAADLVTAWGTSGDIPVPGDYNGDGKSDVAVFRPSDGRWYLQGGASRAWGTTGDVAVPADYDGDGTVDLAVFRPSSGVWYIHPSSGAADRVVAWGATGDIPVPGDYDGDAQADPAVFRQGAWYVQKSTGGELVTAYGTTGDIPAPAQPGVIRQFFP